MEPRIDNAALGGARTSAVALRAIARRAKALRAGAWRTASKTELLGHKKPPLRGGPKQEFRSRPFAVKKILLTKTSK
jgi:hypothetical protein